MGKEGQSIQSRANGKLQKKKKYVEGWGGGAQGSGQIFGGWEAGMDGLNGSKWERKL